MKSLLDGLDDLPGFVARIQKATGLSGNALSEACYDHFELAFTGFVDELKVPQSWRSVLEGPLGLLDLATELEIRMWCIWILEKNIGGFNHAFSEPSNQFEKFLQPYFSKLHKPWREQPGPKVLERLHAIDDDFIDLGSRLPKPMRGIYTWWTDAQTEFQKYGKGRNQKAYDRGLHINGSWPRNQEMVKLRERAIQILQNHGRWGEKHSVIDEVGNIAVLSPDAYKSAVPEIKRCRWGIAVD